MTVSSQPADINLLIWGTKSEDNKRFPDFGKIQAYACTAQKTETFLSRVRESIENIRNYIHSPFQKQYKAETMFLQEQSDEIMAQMAEAAAALSIEVEFTDFHLPEMQLHHSENPVAELTDMADVVLEKAEKLTDKIQKFIKFNSIYGKSYSKTKSPIKLSNNWKLDFQKRSEKLDKILQNKYVVDILDDGTKELQEMLQELWNPIYIIMSAPILNVTDVYDIGTSVGLTEKQFADETSKILAERFDAIREHIRTCPHRKFRTSFRQILPIAALKKLTIRLLGGTTAESYCMVNRIRLGKL